MVEKDELRLMCMIQVLFRYRCMRVDEARQFCAKIIGAADGAHPALRSAAASYVCAFRGQMLLDTRAEPAGPLMRLPTA